MMLLLLVACALVCSARRPEEDLKWQEYKIEFDKHYTEEEEAIRYATWKEAVSEIDVHNAQFGATFEQGINQFTDMTEEEFLKDYCTCNMPEQVGEENNVWMPTSNGPIPNEVDWREHGLVTGVKNQARCGSCYSFAATGALEGAWMKKTGHLVSMSEQQIVDCSTRYGNHGCHGGLFQRAWNYIQNAGGIVSEESYPYTARQGYCRADRADIVATVSGHHDVKRNDEKALAQAIAEVGPIAISIDASPSSFRRYKSGVHYSAKCSSYRHNHAVLAVGYGTENGEDYYLVKNSWGEKYGQDGYVKMARNRGNNCAIASNPSFPTV